MGMFGEHRWERRQVVRLLRQNPGIGDGIYRNTSCYMITDRPVYRPDQTAHYRFWIRTATYATFDDAEFANRKYTLRIVNPKGDNVVETEVTTDAYGGVEGEYVIPSDAPLGRWDWTVADPGTDQIRWAGTLFRVEEYKKPEYEVTVDAPAEPVRLGEVIEAKISAKYYFGSPVTEAKVKYRVTRTATSSSWYPVWRWDWLYGSGSWWFGGDYDWYPGWDTWGWRRPGGLVGQYVGPRRFGMMPPEVVLEEEVDLGADGTVSLKIDTAIARDLFPGTDHRYEITAEVVDQSRRTITGTGSVIASHRPFTVTVWTDRGYYDTGDTVKVQCAARTADGKPIHGTAKVTLYAVDYTPVKEETKPAETAIGEPVTRETEARGSEWGMDVSEFESKTLPVRETVVETWESGTDDSGQSLQSLVAAAPGQYRVAFEVTSEKGEAVTGGYLFSVFAGSDGESAKADAAKYRFNGIELLPDRREYTPGETVRLRVATNQENGFIQMYIRTKENAPWAHPRFIRLEGRSAVVPIEVSAEDIPNFFVCAMTIADGQIHEAVREICVPPVRKVIDVTVKPSKGAYRPGERAKVGLELRDPDGKPMTGPVVVAIYDKSVEYISGGSHIPDMKEFFWSWRRSFSGLGPGYLWTRRDQYPSQVTVWDGLNRPHYPGPLGGMTGISPFTNYRSFPLIGTVDFGVGMTRDGRRSGMRMMGMMGGMDRKEMDVVDGVMTAESSSMEVSAPMLASAPPLEMAESGLNMAAEAEEVGGGLGGGMSGRKSVGAAPLMEATVRSAFADTALWAGSLMTSNDGTAEVELDMPENLTTWKIRVWGLNHETSCGEGSAEVVTRKDLILRMQTPRFLVQTDEVVLTANVHNYLATEKEVTVSLELAGTREDPERSVLELLTEGGDQTQVIRIAPNGESQINWRVRALDEGNAVVRMKALTDEESDAMELIVPCKIHGMLKREAISGVVSPDATNGSMRFTVPAQRRAEQT
ncbi:MAG: MG2 domain-containing protein, partial [Planctomycetia bacterium]|nr:MG2 domain-containing protein [Planctomycetia bacterium]